MYAQAQAQAQVSTSQVPYLAPPLTTFVQPSTQSGLKLSKLVKETRLLGCETFSRIVDAVAAKNWLKKISDTLTDVELDDSLKLRVATRLMNKSAATW